MLPAWGQPASPGPGPERKLQPMPVLTGIKLDQAQARLKEAHLQEPRVAYVEGPEGVVMRQIPAAGTGLENPKIVPQLFVGQPDKVRKVTPSPTAARPAPPPVEQPPRTNWLVLALTALGLTLVVGSLAARWSPDGDIKITRRERKRR